MVDEGKKPRVVIVGGGFGGLEAARALASAAVDVLLIDRLLKSPASHEAIPMRRSPRP